MMHRADGMNMRVRGILSASTMAFVVAVAAQCPGVRPKFSWASNGSTIEFVDQTDAYVTNRLWQFGDGDTSAEAFAPHEYAFAGDDTVHLSVTVGGCSFSVSGRVVHPGVNDNCFSQITSAFTAEQTGNNQMHFTDLSQGDGSFLLSLWTFGDESLSSASDTVNHFYALPRAYDVSHSIGTVDSLFQTACVAGSAERVYVDGNTSTCDSSLFLNLVIETEGNLVYCNAEAVLFNADLAITSWVWDYGDGTPEDWTGVPLAQHYYGFGGDVQICVELRTTDTTNGDTCFARNCVSVSMPALVGVDELPDRGALRAHPVPFTEEIWIDGDAVQRGAQWRMIDALGREAGGGIVAQNGTDRLALGTLPSGVYTLVIAHDQRVRTLRLSKQ